MNPKETKETQPGVDATIDNDASARAKRNEEAIAKRDAADNAANAKKGPGRSVRKGDLVLYVMPKGTDTDGGTRPAFVVNDAPPDLDPVATRNKWLEAHPDKAIKDYEGRDKDEDPQPKVNLVVLIDGHPDTQWRRDVPYALPVLRSAGKQPGDLTPNTWHWFEQSPEFQERRA
jgi:hypothetical protein